MLYILSALTGIAFMPDIGIEKATFTGGLKVYRVYGGTFFGELFFLGYIYQWITGKFRFHQLFLAILFIIPHILAFGRAAWIFFAFSIIIMLFWNSFKTKGFKVFLRQGIIITVFGAMLVYAFTKFIPGSETFTEAIEARIIQGQEDGEYKEGTYETRLANIGALIDLWQSSNILFGIGMHPMWVIKPITEEENIYAWGFSDVGWTSVLAAYGLVGFLLAIVFQIFYTIFSFKVLRMSVYNDILIYFVLSFLIRLIFDSVINYSYKGLTVGLWGFAPVAFNIAVLAYKYEFPDEEYKL